MTGLQLQDSTSWQKVYDEMRRGEVISPTSFKPIPPFVIGRLFSSHTLMITTDSQEALARWWLGVRVQMIIDAPGTDFLSISADLVAIPVNRGRLVRFSKLSTLYRLRVEVPAWHQSMRVTIWEYSGDEGAATEAGSVDLIREDLQRIEGKVNSLL